MNHWVDHYANSLLLLVIARWKPRVDLNGFGIMLNIVGPVSRMALGIWEICNANVSVARAGQCHLIELAGIDSERVFISSIYQSVRYSHPPTSSRVRLLAIVAKIVEEPCVGAWRVAVDTFAAIAMLDRNPGFLAPKIVGWERGETARAGAAQCVSLRRLNSPLVRWVQPRAATPAAWILHQDRLTRITPGAARTVPSDASVPSCVEYPSSWILIPAVLCFRSVIRCSVFSGSAWHISC